MGNLLVHGQYRIGRSPILQMLEYIDREIIDGISRHLPRLACQLLSMQSQSVDLLQSVIMK